MAEQNTVTCSTTITTSGSLKLLVEVCNAKNLMPKDGHGTASAYAVVDFDGQRRRTKTQPRDLNPRWDERLEFSVLDPDNLQTKTLEINLHNDNKSAKRSTFLGKVRIAASAFANSEALSSLVYYPLEKRSVFSQIKGEIGLKVFLVHEEQQQQTAVTLEAEKPPPEEEKKQEVVKEEQDQKPPPPPPEKAEPVKVVEAEKVAVAEAETKKAEADREDKPEALKKSNKDAALELRSMVASDRNGRHSACDLVDRMPFLYVRIVKAKLADQTAATAASYAKLAIGTHSVRTTSRAAGNKDWDQVFAFDKDGLNSTTLEVSVWTEREVKKDGDQVQMVESCVGTVSFDLGEVPKRVPPDSPLAPQWYSLEEEKQPGNDVMLAVWIGTQADEAFQEAWQSDSGGLLPETRAKVYLSPKLWYLRLTVIQTQDLQLGSAIPEAKAQTQLHSPEVYVKAQLGAQLFKTSRIVVGSAWNEDLMFVAAEPFEPFLVVTVDDVAQGLSVGHVKLQVPMIEKRMDDQAEPKSKWFNLIGDESRPYAGRIHLRACLEGGYHVLDEAAHATSDVRAAAKQLSKAPIGLLEVGIRGATNLLPVKTKDSTRGTTDAYVVAKYGPKWVCTRTILDRFNPRWNEHYTWDVYDPCTVLTIGVFDNGRYKRGDENNGNGKSGKDVQLGKVRVRLSTLDTNRVYITSYSLMILLPGGAKKMGEIEIAVRFSCSSWMNLIQAYANPMLPRMHYVRPLAPAQQDILRHVAMRMVAARLARSEPALGQEVVQYLLDSDSQVWSMRRSKANWFRVVGCLSRAATVARWADEIRTWAHPPTTVLMHVLLVAGMVCPNLILPTMFLYFFLIMLLRFRHCRKCSSVLPSMDKRVSQAEAVGPDELDEEFDGFPSARGPDVIRVRYDRLRALAGRAQTVLGDLAAQGERVEALFSWRDPRASGIFVVFCLAASVVLYTVPFKVFVLGSGFYYIRHPRFRGDMPSLPMNFFRRLPSLSDQIM